MGEGIIYNKDTFIGFYMLKGADGVFLLFDCGNDRKLVSTLGGDDLIFVDKIFIDAHFKKLGSSKLLHLLYGVENDG